MDYKKAIKRHLRRGTFETVRTTKGNISITQNQLSNSSDYYIERKKEGLLVLNKKLNHLTLYIQQMK